ncbi:unnamed protein product, partial [Iphiclides podalirius]
MEKIKLYEEYRLIEKTEAEVNGAWKGAHLLLFFMAFVFGSFCTFCFHMMMYLFDEKCVLFPKLLSLTSLRNNLIYEFIPDEKMAEMLPVDFLSTQWVDKSACYLPTYVPLVSGIFGLVWTTMFLMCSASSRTLTGLQRPWRVLPPVFVFSILMGCLCIYSSAVTHYGLQELCIKLGEITGSTTCTYTVNVATLAYERRIRGVYQATRLTVASAWLHTICWLLSAMLALARVLLAVDFHLVRVTAHLQGNIDRMLERYERHVRTVTPDLNVKDYNLSYSVTRVHFQKPFNIYSPNGGSSSATSITTESSRSVIVRQFGQERIKSMSRADSRVSPGESREYLSIDLHGEEEVYSEIRNDLVVSLNKTLEKARNYESVMNVTPDMIEVLERQQPGPSHRDTQVDEEKGPVEPTVPVEGERNHESRLSPDTQPDVDNKEEQKTRKKEKQD